MPSAPVTFSTYLRHLIAADGRLQRDFAAAIGRTSSQLSRALHGGKPFDMHVCFRLARFTGRPPAEVLRAAGHIEAANVIDHFYSVPPSRTVLTQDEERFVLRLRAFPEVRHAFEGILKATEDHAAPRRSLRPKTVSIA